MSATEREVQIVLFDLKQREVELRRVIAEAEEKLGITPTPDPEPFAAHNANAAAVRAKRRSAKAAVTGDPRKQPRWLRTIRWAAPCASCGVEIPAGPITGDPIFYVPGQGAKSEMHHESCAIRAGLTRASA